MKKQLLAWSARLNALILYITLFFVGVQIANLGPGTSIFRSVIDRRTPPFLILPLVAWVFMKVGAYFRNTPHYAKEYCLFAVVTLLFGNHFWMYKVYRYIESSIQEADKTPIFNYIWIMLAISVLVAVFYFICAYITQKEERSRESASQ